MASTSDGTPDEIDENSVHDEFDTTPVPDEIDEFDTTPVPDEFDANPVREEITAQVPVMIVTPSNISQQTSEFEELKQLVLQQSALIRQLLSQQPPSPIPSSNSSTIIINSLKVPEKPCRQGGRTIQTLPYVVSGDEYINMKEQLDQKKIDEEARKQKRRDDLCEKKERAKADAEAKKKERIEKSLKIKKIKQEADEAKKARKRKAQDPATHCDVQTSLPPKPKRGRPKKTVAAA